MVGTTLGRYRIQSVLGHGGMGEVYAALDPQLDRRVAIKIMAPEAAANAPMVERFLREGRAASALNHPNIVTVHEVGQTDAGQYYIVQELVEGQTLRRLLAGGLPYDRVCHVGRQLAKALATAHSAGIVHRDIKPENVMVRPDGYIKVLDFGLAHITLPEQAASEMETASRVTAQGTIIGTTPYMSPEQIGGKPISASSDIFSLGVVFYEMLGGRLPFTGDSSLAILTAIVNEHPVPLGRLKPELPAALGSLVMSMLDKDRAVRPSATDVDGTLDQILGSAIVMAPVATVAPRRTVGREAERRALLEMFQGTVSGRGRIATVTGEPGIGKTSLVEEVLAEIALGPHRPVIVRGRCSERLNGAEAYLPILEVLDSLLHGQTVGRFTDMMKTLAPTWYIHVGMLSADSTSAQQLKEDTKIASPERMKRELAALLESISRARPLVLFLDDLHWADISTVDVLNYLAQRFADLRIFVMVTYRSSEMVLGKHPFLAVSQDLQTRGTLQEFALDFLGRADVERYLDLEFPGHALPDELGVLIHEKTGGSPLFMVDLLRDLRDRGAIVRDAAGCWTIAKSISDITRELPETVKSTIARKLDRLDETDRRLLTTAAIQGYEFDTLVLSDVLALDPADVEERMDAIAGTHHLAKNIGTAESADRVLTVRYRFVHGLYQNVLYASLQPTRRAQTSAKVARAIEARFAGDPNRASELALLFETAREFPDAARNFLLAAQHQIALFAFREGVAMARRGLDALTGVKDEAIRTQLEIGLQVALASCLRAVDGWAAPSVEKIYLRVRDILEQTGDESLVFPIRWGITLVQGVRSDLASWRVACEDNLRRADTLQNPVYIVAASQMLGAALEFLGETTQSAAMLGRCAALYEPARHQTYVDTFGLDAGMIGRSLWIRELSLLGQLDRARDIGEETIAMARTQRQPVSLAFALVMAQHLYILRGERDRLLEISTEVIDLCRAIGLVQETEWGRTFQAWGTGDAGDRDAAIEELRDALARQLAIGSYTSRTAFLGILAEQLLRAGRADEGLAAVEESFAHTKRSGECYFVADSLRWRGELLLLKGDTAGAEASLREAIEVASRQKALLFELRAAMGLARILQTRGERADAHALLSGVYGRFTEGHDAKALREAGSLMEELARG
jgi:tetratricopeptide (TPR) repeat protein/type II secretory pathway predicted ATPase ExeA